ncbi:MAG: hypothetical protein Q9214_004352, partial [Letrouitia sp. 1 TL-2023]
TKVSYNALPLAPFSTLTKRVFHVYFRLQSLLFLLTALTHPPMSLVSLVKEPGDIVPLALGAGIAVWNMLVWGPRTEEAMRKRNKTQGVKKDADTDRESGTIEKGNGEGDKREDRERGRDGFKKTHAMCIHLNLVAIMATAWYGCRMVSRYELAQ